MSGAASVVIVDDSLTVRMDLGEAFGEAGFETVLCGTAAEARSAFAAGRPDLVVLDVVLPDADGVALLEELRRAPATEDVPVMMLSGEDEVRHRIRGLSLGANVYVGKPYQRPYVVARAAELVRPARGVVERAPLVLVVDDSETQRHALAEALASAGYRVEGAASGRDGLSRAAALLPDAIVVDGLMPGMDGTEFVRRIRLDAALATTPCLLVTAAEGAGGEVAALDSGADAYLRKSESPEVALARLAAILRVRQARGGPAPTASLSGPKRILAVDDSPTFLSALATALSADGYEVVRASSGEEALELLAVERVDCILLDRMMPGLSGTETCLRIKAVSALRDVPLVLLTAMDEPGAMVDGMEAGADDYVAKSASFDVVKARVHAQLRRRHFEDENRRIREQIVRSEAEARAAVETAALRAELLRQLEVKNGELSALNEELRSFAYTVSHDLGQPLRSIEGFADALLEDYGAALDERGRHYLTRVRAGAQRMGQLIEGLLALSRVTRRPLQKVSVRLDVAAARVVQRLREAAPDRRVEVVIDEPMECVADAQLVESVLENLLGNAWKFTALRPVAHVRVGLRGDEAPPVYFVEDDGAGFAPEQAEDLFTVFRRAHSEREFPGTGIGLATTQRIVTRHGGRIWAEGRRGEGATFFFTLAPSPGAA